LTNHHDDAIIVRTWHEIATNALISRASDIHIEARHQETLIRIRVDGLLQAQSQLPIDFHDRLITRIKILARLDISEKRLPQDGRMLVGHDFAKPNIDCRVSILPTLYGEKAVVRILPNSYHELSLQKIGLLPEQLSIFQNALNFKNGLILVTGPTGSGKTRTLYSCLQELNQIHRNICAIEDPIEIRLPGVNQVAYHPRAGLDFPTIIRSLLRQDPDVIMIGEIRDGETAKLAIQAAQTGHLVLSTLHTRDAKGTLSRLRSLGIDEEALQSCILSVSSQRLVRRICSSCLGHITSETAVCQFCKGSLRYGCVGVHEVLSHSHLFDSHMQYVTMYEAGLEHVKAGLILQADLEEEVGRWH
jgi:type II secretory ATPase GspE/PulE/Tfp pilus assembly ATPase PilB-like protein